MVKCLVSVYSRETAHQRTARYSVTAHDAATTYFINISATAINHVNGGDTRADQTIRGLVTAINGSAGIQPFASALAVNAAGVDVTSTPYDGSTAQTILDTSATEVLITSVTEDGFFISTVETGGAGTSETIADPETCSLRVWATRKVSSGVAQWVLVNDGQEDIDRRGWTERLTVNGYRRLYVEVYACGRTGDGLEIKYAPGIFIGPAVLE